VSSPKPFVGVIMECCSVYTRIYLDKEGRRFVGRCPKCLRRVEVKVSKEGAPDRFLIAR